MSVGKMSVDKMFVDQMTWFLASPTCAAILTVKPKLKRFNLEVVLLPEAFSSRPGPSAIKLFTAVINFVL